MKSRETPKRIGQQVWALALNGRIVTGAFLGYTRKTPRGSVFVKVGNKGLFPKYTVFTHSPV